MSLLEKYYHNKFPIAVDQQSEDTPKDFIQLFREQANTHPYRAIVLDREDYITYDELDKKSDCLAGYLQSIGVKPNNLVGLCASLNTNFIVSMLGILKAGAAYFPLDSEYPVERLQYMVKEGNPTIILAESQFTRLFKHHKVINIEQNIFDIKYRFQINHENFGIRSENLAYVVYTSGTTGNPKGIMITHKSLPYIASAHKDYYHSEMRMLLSGGVCFDASLLVIFYALANDAPLYLFNNVKDSVDDLINFLNANSIDFMISVPSQYLKVLQKNCPLPFLKCVSLTGENLPRSLCHLHARLAPDTVLYNEYGPTEYAIGTTIAQIYSPKSGVARQITVGKPLPNTEVYILDKNLNILPEGSKGEICIGGVGLAQGYLNNEDLTTDKFVYVRNSQQELLRLYRTGDIGCFLSNGQLSFLGRFEHNIQVCGHCINLGEVEYHISHCSYIQESAVLVQNTSQGEKQIVVYITSLKKSAKSSLLRYLKTLLPKNVRFSVIQVNEFPLSPNGKIDRSKLISLHG